MRVFASSSREWPIIQCPPLGTVAMVAPNSSPGRGVCPLARNSHIKDEEVTYLFATMQACVHFVSFSFFIFFRRLASCLSWLYMSLDLGIHFVTELGRSPVSSPRPHASGLFSKFPQ
jgi:hypothetical protein